MIHYGNRWDDARESVGLADRTNAYTHQERFLPIFTVAEALLAYLERVYDVQVADDPSAKADFEVVQAHRSDHLERIVRVQPASPLHPPLLIGFASSPGLDERLEDGTHRFKCEN